MLSVYDGPAENHGEWVRDRVGGVQASIVTVPLLVAFEQAFESIKRCGRLVAVGMPKGNISIPISRLVTTGIEIIGSTLGTRKELAEALEFAKAHQIKCKIEKRRLSEINEIFDRMSQYQIHGRIVIDFTT